MKKSSVSKTTNAKWYTHLSVRTRDKEHIGHSSSKTSWLKAAGAQALWAAWWPPALCGQPTCSCGLGSVPVPQASGPAVIPGQGTPRSPGLSSTFIKISIRMTHPVSLPGWCGAVLPGGRRPCHLAPAIPCIRNQSRGDCQGSEGTGEWLCPCSLTS